MGDILKCPRCASDVDVTSFAAGSTVRCSDCGGMLRVPTGRTGVHVAVKDKTTTRPRTAAVSAAAAPQKRDGGTRMRQAAVSRGTQVRRQKSSSTTYVLLGLLAVALIIGGVVLFLGTPAPPAEPPASAVKPPPKLPQAKAPPTPAPAPPTTSPAVPAPAPEGPRGDEAARTNWEDILRNLRGGGGFDVPGRPEQVYFQRVQRMGKSAYAHLIRFIDNEDPALGRAAVALLNALTNQNKPLPTEATRAKLKEEWQAWVNANP